MKKPERITITSFWLDWLLLPIMIGAGWLTLRWALADFDLAKSLRTWSGTLPACVVSIPLMLCALGWIILGFGSLIREEYYEHQIWVAILILWSLCCLVGAAVIGFDFLQGNSSLGVAGILNLTGLVLTALILYLPSRMQVPLGDKAVRFSRIWTALLAVCAGCLLAGLLLGFPYSFPRFPLGIGALCFFGLGALKVMESMPALPWLPRLYDLDMKQEVFLAGLPKSSVWRIEGVVKLVVGIGIAATLIIASL